MIRKAFLTLSVAAALFIPCTSFAQSVSVAGNAAIGGQLNVTNTTNSTSPTTGAATIAGGLGVGGNLNVGGTISGTISPPTENPNTVYAGPSSGSPAAASFRALTQADLPNVTPSGGNTASPVPTILGRVVSVTDFGAACNGVTDDTSVINAAITSLASSGGGTIRFPAGSTCLIKGTITINANNIHLQGAGTGTTTLDFAGTGTGDGFLIGTNPSSANCVGSSPPSNCQQDYNISIANMTISASSRTGGYIFDINGASQTTISDIQIGTAWDVFKAQFFNNLLFQRINSYSNDTSGFVTYIYNAITTGTSSGWYRSDVLTMNDFTLNAQGKGSSCFVWDGMVNTVRMDHVAMLDCNYAYVINNTQHSTSYFPAFLQANDIEADGTTNNALAINGGNYFTIVNSDLDSSGATASSVDVINISPDTSYSYTRGIKIAASNIHDTANEAAYINGIYVTLDDDQFFDTGHVNTNPPVIELGPAATDVSITGSFVGQMYGDPDQPGYGVYVDSGAARIALTGNNYRDAKTASIYNGTSSAIGFVGGVGSNWAPITSTSCPANTACTN